MEVVQSLSTDLALRGQIEKELEATESLSVEEKEVYTQALIKLNKAIKTKETLLGKMTAKKNVGLQEKTNINSGLSSLITEVVQQELLTLSSSLTINEGGSSVGGLGSGNWFRKKKTFKDSQDTSDMSPEELQAIVGNFVNKTVRRGGDANLTRKDMETLDKLTRWMKYIPGGTVYRRTLAKYLRSKKDRNSDPLKDFRRYSYSDSASIDEAEEPTLSELVSEIMNDNNEDEKVLESPEGLPSSERADVFYHGTSFGNLKPGSLILPPSKTGKQSEKDRKKNLDQVFFTKDPRSALVYAGRAAQSLGGTGAVYVVEPQGPVSLLNGTEGTTVYYAPYAKVIRPASKEELAKKKK